MGRYKQDVATLAYTAGIIDGEGCISIHKWPVETKRRHVYSLRVTVGHTNEWLIEWLRFNFGGSIRKRSAKKLEHKPFFEWQLTTNQALNFLILILPYLHIKRPNAELGISFQRRRKPSELLHYKSDYEWALDETDKILMAKYNKKGIEKEA